jgi:voltage-gated potassium channel
LKFLTTLIAAMSARSAEGSVRALSRLLVVIGAAVVGFSVGFHAIMAMEGREFSWLSSFYWTLVTMTTLGYGDIVFETDVGRIYSLVVLVVGSILILVMLPFTFIQLVWLPLQRAAREARAPRRLPESSDHVILTSLDAMNVVLIDRLKAAGIPYVVLVDDVERAIELHDDGWDVAVGAIDDPQTYRNIHAERAAMLFATRSDTANTNAAFTMREVTDRGLVVATANSADAVDILELAGCDRVLQLGELLGRALARRILAPTAASRAISAFEDLVVAETSAVGTPLVGCSLADLDLRQRFGVSVVGLWDRGRLQMARPDLVIEETSIVLLTGTAEALAAYDEEYAPGRRGETPPDDGHVVIIGGGRVGRAVAAALREAGTPFRIVERLPDRVRDPADYVVGDAEDIEVLREAGIEEASAVVVTTHEDDMNLWLTLYCRRLRSDAEILGRVNLDRNLSTMHRAGADFVLSYASMGAMEAWNSLRVDSSLLLAEGLVIFRVAVPDELVGRSLRSVDIPAETGCTVIGIVRAEGCVTDLDIDASLEAGTDLVLVADDVGEARFLARYVARRPRSVLDRLLRRRRPA